MTSHTTQHVAFVSFVGLRVREQELLALGITLPGLGDRQAAVAQLPALGLLTLAGMMPTAWSCSYYEADEWGETLVDRIVAERPAFVAVSALTVKWSRLSRPFFARNKLSIGESLS